jgi:hypothetical protein
MEIEKGRYYCIIAEHSSFLISTLQCSNYPSKRWHVGMISETCTVEMSVMICDDRVPGSSTDLDHLCFSVGPFSSMSFPLSLPTHNC